MLSKYDDFLKVINHLITIQFVDSDFLVLKNSIYHAESLKTDRDKIYYVYQSFKNYLWLLKEAVDMGFHKWVETQFPLILEELNYIEKNGEEYERKRPRIH